MSFKPEGLGDRLSARLAELGFVGRDGRPDVSRFSQERGYDKTNVYNWLRGKMPHGPVGCWGRLINLKFGPGR